MLEALKKYAVFEGRARRQEYWLFILLYAIVYFAASVLDAVIGTTPLLNVLVLLGFLVPGISAGVRRLHDIDKSGWMYVLVLIPIVNLVLLVFLCFDGTAGPNRYGEDPKGRGKV